MRAQQMVRSYEGFCVLSIENCQNRLAIKSGLFSCFPHSKRSDLCFQAFASYNASSVIMDARVVDSFL